MGDSRNRTVDNSSVDKKTEELVQAVLESEEYREYLECLAKIKEQPPVYGFGMGDVVLMAAGGLMLGVKATVTAALIAIVTGAVYGIILKSVKKNKEDSSNAFAFGPFLIVGLAVGTFFGGSLIDMYLSRLHIM